MTHARPPLIRELPDDLIDRYAALWRQQANAALADAARQFSRAQAHAYEAEQARRKTGERGP